ncbi:uncharacterized protein F5891DRAFT_1189703 [Suillus fuscotomentosus]|uniref:DUF6532 domain-containing protein n=1 Tax=Suillus fuscotomentosus TaxID=1912939 RepID=A0AAD4E564_9AGAM|nr:uncharacterized protein F5891DRAFT_1189703 [Suillus fuscotomentosus]KAG1899552.1 hypothetical protein F5891DRAFT_1189703 [Suillus fuscotomentosus]
MPSLVKMMARQTSHVCGETKMGNRDLAETLKEGSSFVFKEKKSDIYKSDLIQAGINDMWFMNHIDEGIIYAEYFDPFLVKMLALILTVIECCIDEWATDMREDIKFAAVIDSPVYLTASYKLLEKITDNFLNVAQFHASINLPKAAVTVKGFTDDIFDDTIQEYKVETWAKERGEGLDLVEEEEEKEEEEEEEEQITHQTFKFDPNDPGNEEKYKSIKAEIAS